MKKRKEKIGSKEEERREGKEGKEKPLKRYVYIIQYP